MAKYKVRHTCGHTVEYDFIGPLRKRYEFIHNLSQGECSECGYKKFEEWKKQKGQENDKATESDSR